MFANSYKQGMIYEDAILQNHKEAIQRVTEIGKEKVINGTLGVLFHKATLVTFDTVDRLIPHLDIKGISAYTPQQGLPDFLDMAYMDFAPAEEKQVFQKLAHLEANVFPIIDYTISKSLTKYGLRTAALIGLHKDKAVLEEFRNIIAISNRGNYGSVNSVGQLLVVELYKNKALLNDYYNELDHWRTLLNKRAETFMNHINKEIITPYKNGFFVSIKSSSPLELTEQLKKENIFLVPLKKGVRVALCSIEEEELVAIAETLNKMLP